MYRVSRSVPEENKPKLVVGIDFGTSFSGAAYSVHVGDAGSSRDATISEVTDWKHAKNPYCRYSHKVPSDIAYDEHGKAFCGFDLPEGCTRLKWTKILLETDPDPSVLERLNHRDVKASKAAIEKLGKSPVQVVADYLRWLWERILEAIIDDTSWDQDDIDNANPTIVMTVPAMWSDMARHNTAQAAELAGLAREGWTLKFITEPEAAAISELHERMGKGLSAGDCFIVCDGGGGTVDLVSFEIRNKMPFTLDQKTVAAGGLCGSIYIDQMFEDQIKSLLQGDWDKLSDTAKTEIREKFAYVIKPSFEGQLPGSLGKIPLPIGNDVEFEHIQGNTLHIPEDLVKASFETVVPRIQLLIDEQEEELKTLKLRDKLTGILLVGGLGCCEYLRKRVAESYSRADKIKVFKGKKSWTSVVTGAVRCELMSLGNIEIVNTRLSRWNYGFRYNMRFDPYNDDHQIDQVYDCEIEKGVKKARQVAWVVRKGQELKPNARPEMHEFVRIFTQSDFVKDKAIMWLDVHQSNETQAPNWPTKAVKPCVNLECHVPKSLVLSESSGPIPGQELAWRVRIRVEIIVLPAILEFKCWIGGKEVGVAKVSYRAMEKTNDQTPSTSSTDPAGSKADGSPNVQHQNDNAQTVAKSQSDKTPRWRESLTVPKHDRSLSADQTQQRKQSLSDEHANANLSSPSLPIRNNIKSHERSPSRSELA